MVRGKTINKISPNPENSAQISKTKENVFHGFKATIKTLRIFVCFRLPVVDRLGPKQGSSARRGGKGAVVSTYFRSAPGGADPDSPQTTAKWRDPYRGGVLFSAAPPSLRGQGRPCMRSAFRQETGRVNVFRGGVSATPPIHTDPPAAVVPQEPGCEASK
jgi:hypothetical protein